MLLLLVLLLVLVLLGLAPTTLGLFEVACGIVASSMSSAAGNQELRMR